MNTHQQRLPSAQLTSPSLPPQLIVSVKALNPALGKQRPARATILAGHGRSSRRIRRQIGTGRQLAKLLAVVGWVLAAWVLCSSPVQAAIRLNELYPAPNTGESEWVELFNDSSTESVNLSGWWLQDQVSSPSVITTLADLVISPLSYLKVEWSASKLNNTGDTVILIDQDNQEHYRVQFNDAQVGSAFAAMANENGDEIWLWQSPTPGNNNDPNASPYPSPSVNPTPSPNQSGAPSPSVLPSGSPCPTPLATPTPVPTPTPIASVSPTASPTPSPTPTPSLNPSPTPTPSSNPSPSPNVPVAQVGNLTITAVMACPSDNQPEWIEIYNTTSQTLNLQGWHLKDASQNKRNLTGTITSHQFLKIEFSSSFINNTNETLYLYSPSNQLAQTIELPDCEGKGIPFVPSTTGWIAQSQVTDSNQETTNQQSEQKTKTSSGSVLGETTPLAATTNQIANATKQLVAGSSAKVKELFANQQLQLSIPESATKLFKTPEKLFSQSPSKPHFGWWYLASGGGIISLSTGYRLLKKGILKFLTNPSSLLNATKIST